VSWDIQADVSFVCGKGMVRRCTVKYDAFMCTYGVKGVSELLTPIQLTWRIW